jgi:subtilisin family serine protease
MLLQVSAASWGLQRVGAPRRATDGAGVHAYVIDTGIRKTHAELAGRTDWIGDFVGATSSRPVSGDARDCDPGDGHGTHVAGILGGRTHGVAPAVQLHGLRILPCTGTTRTDPDAAIHAVDWITEFGRKPAVVNISPLRLETTDTRLDEAIRRSIRAGFVYVVSAGGLPDLSRFTPQRIEEVIVVGATTPEDRAMQSDYGPRLTLFAPGARTEAAGSAADDAIVGGDGDSYAAPVVAAIAAMYLQHNTGASAADVKRALLAAATRDAIANTGRAPNLLAHVIGSPSR